MSTRENARPAILNIDHLFDVHAVDEHDEDTAPFADVERVVLDESNYIPWPSGILQFLDEGGSWKPYHRRNSLRHAISGDRGTIHSFIKGRLGASGSPPSSFRLVGTLNRPQRTIDVDIPCGDRFLRYSCGVESPTYEDPVPSFRYALWDSSPSDGGASGKLYKGRILVEDVRGVEGGRPVSPCLLSGRWPVHRAYADRLIAGPPVGYLVFH